MRALYIVLILSLVLCLPHLLVAGENQGDRFQVVDNAYVVDSETGLMWALQDNGKDIDWWEATSYCEEFAAGGYEDWRMPDIKELATLYLDGKSNGDGYSLTPHIKVTDCCVWSSYDVLGGAMSLSFKSGKHIPIALAETYQLRALPVRGTSKVDLKQYKNF